jgi:hypothetical protein
MRKMFSAVLCVVLIAALSGVALARETHQADRRVQVNVEPTVTVVNLSPLSTPTIQPGHEDAVIEVGFMIDSNSQMLKIGAAASDLFKGDVPGGQYSLIRKDGVVISCPLARPLNGVSSRVPYTPSTVTISGFTAYLTEQIIFESSQNNRFSLPCYLKFTWGTTDSELPTGQYSGYVRFIGTVVPPGTTGP